MVPNNRRSKGQLCLRTWGHFETVTWTILQSDWNVLAKKFNLNIPTFNFKQCTSNLVCEKCNQIMNNIKIAPAERYGKL